MVLACVVIGSGILAERLSAGNSGVALIGNTMATVAALSVLILTLGEISGAHFNPAVSLAMFARGQLSRLELPAYVVVQVVGMIAGAWIAHAMFGLPVLQTSLKVRSTLGEGLGEFVATFWLLFTIWGTLSARPNAVWITVPEAITAGYWFTSSTSFANPAITIARSMSNTFAGVQPADVIMFIGAQLFGTLIATSMCAWLFALRRK